MSMDTPSYTPVMHQVAQFPVTSAQARPGGVSLGINTKLPAAINALDLGCIRFKLLQPGSPVKWTNEQAQLVEDEYRKFLALRLLHPDTIIVPDATVDVFWHQHILDTEKYAEDCQRIFGKFMHHFPYFGLRGENDQKDLMSGFSTTIQLYASAFGDAPPNMWQMAADCGRLGCAPGPTGG